MKIFDTFEHQGVKGMKFGSFPFSKPKIFAHTYFIDGLLIDTAHPNMRKEAMAIFQTLPITQLVLTHHHEDHSGNAQAVQDHFLCLAYASSECVKIMQKPPKLSLAQHITWGDRPPNVSLLTINNIISTPKYTFEVIPIPGHAVDMIALYERNEGWLFSADLYVHHRIKMFMQPESMQQQINSLQRVLKLDFDTLFCSHNPQFNRPKELIKKKLDYFQNYYSEVVKFHHQGYSAKQIYKKMGFKPLWNSRIMTQGTITGLNMVKAVIRDEEQKQKGLS